MALDLRPIDILLVEDDAADVLLTQETFAEHKILNRLTAVNDGASALAYLHREGRYADAVRPHLVLLDLDLPGIDGREVLDRVTADPDLCTIPVVVLTNSIAERDILRARRLSVADYVVKPVDFARLVEVVRRIADLALLVVRVPGD